MIKAQQDFAQLRVRAEEAALKTARKRNLVLILSTKLIKLIIQTKKQRQELREINQQRDEMAKRMNNQGTRKATIKSRLQKILKDRNMQK